MSRCKAVSTVALTVCAFHASISLTNANEPDSVVKFGREGTVKLRLTDMSVLPQFQQRDALIIADYVSFTIVEVPAGNFIPVPGSEIIERENLILLNAGPIDTTTAYAKGLQSPRSPFDGKALHLIQFAGPVKPEWHAAIESTGVEIVTYIPSNAFLVYGNAASLNEVQSLAKAMPEIQWEAAYRDEYKIDPRAFDGEDQFAIQLVADSTANTKTLEVIDRLKLAPIQSEYSVLNYHNIVVRIAPDKIAELAKQPDIVSIQPYETPILLDERQDQIVAGNLTGNNPSGPGYLAWLGTKGFTQAQFTASAFIVDLSDSPVDQGNTTPNHFGLWENGAIGSVSHLAYQRKVAGTVLTTPSPQKGCDGHGNINAHIIGGYDNLAGFPFADASGFHYGLGVCPFVKIGSSGIFTTSGSFTSPNYTTLQSNAYNNGARISSNSWGNTSGNTYNTDAQTYDSLVRDAQPASSPFPVAGNQEMTIVFAAGNSGPSSNTVHPPSTGKNLIVVGASENVQAFGGADLNCGTTDSEANSANDMASFSSRGPCSDGRKKPDIVAPGTHVSGGVNQTASPSSTGTNDCFTGSGVCGGFNSIYFPNSGQQFYTASSGTSHSTPAVAGGAALVRQFFINQGMSAPSPAMIKAFLMNSASYMTGTGANDTLWSNSQGMGLMNLGDAFDRGAVTPTVFRDQVGVDMFTSTGQTRTFTGTISNTSKPFRVTLAWTDAPGATSGAAYKNNLDLTVTIGANNYRGNVFSGANSTTGGSADVANNVESVFLPAGTGGSFTATITASSINSDGVPNVGGSLDQDFALLIYNGTTASVPVIAGTNSTITAQSCSPGNNAIDPGEVVTVDFTLQNVGSANTSNVVATLQATGGVTSPSAAQNYGAMTAGGASVTRSFSFTANGTCGSTLTATLQIQDGASNLGSVTFNFTLGSNAVSFSQNFDGVTAPALPSGWTATIGSGSPTLWVTSSSSSDTSPNALFAGDPSTTTDNRITSPNIAITSAASTFSFRHNYITESSWDGGVLEISIAGGAFTDFLTAGGSFTSGSYVSNLNSSANPLTGRAAWNGNSGGYITTSGTFPPAAVGQNIQLRWRMGSDGSIGSTGWRVDTVSISQPTCCSDPCPGGTPATPTNQLATPSSVCTGSSASLTANVGAGETVDWYSASCGGTLVGSGSGLNVSPSGTTTYFARARNTSSGCTSASCASVTLTVNTVPSTPTSPVATPASICAALLRPFQQPCRAVSL
ncbi:MAG: S8 family serine peptidase [Planctomycetes bacterium]|nr:S8 family serine peptidase [Planctomycetota bacterium]